jgi:hypothetical protein
MRHTNTHIVARAKKVLSAWTVACIVMTLARGPSAMVQTAEAASSFRPTIFVNTEAFLIIDDDDTSADVVMRFGDTLAKTLSFNRSFDRFEFNDDVYVSGTVQATNTVSGAVIYGAKSLRSSGSLVWEGAASGSSLIVSNNVGIAVTTAKAKLAVNGIMSGVTVYATRSFSGAGLSDCDTAGTSKLMWDATTGRFSCGTDTDTNTTYTAGQGLALNGTSFRLNTTVTGSVIQAANTIASSGTLVWEGTASGNQLNVMGNVGIGTASPSAALQIGNGGSVTQGGFGGASALIKTLLSDTTSGRYTQLAIKGPTNGGAAVEMYDGSGNPVMDFGIDILNSNAGFVNRMTSGKMQFYTNDGTTLASRIDISATGNVGINKSDPKTKLDVAGAISGSFIYATKSFSGAGLTDCDSGTSKLLWDATTGRFSCGTVTSSNWSGTGALQNAFDNRYVNTAGDTMTGKLTIDLTSNSLVGLEVNEMMSGSRLQITGSGMFQGGSIDDVVLSVRGGPAQAASLQEWQAFGGTMVANINTVGDLYTEGNASAYLLTTRGVPGCNGSNALATDGDGVVYCDVDDNAGYDDWGTGYFNIGDGSTYEAITNAETINFVDGTGIDVVVSPTDTVTISSNNIYANDMNQNVGTDNDVVFNALNVTGATNLSGNVGIGAGITTTKAKLSVNGVMSGVTLYATKSFSGAGLTDCDTGGTSKLLWDATTGRFSCGTDSGATYTAGQGLTLNGTAFSLGQSISGTLLEFQTVSGSTVYGSKSLRSSGSLVWEGAGSGSSLSLAGGNMTVSSTGDAVFNENGLGTVDFRVEGDTNTNGLFFDASARSGNGALGIGIAPDTGGPALRIDGETWQLGSGNTRTLVGETTSNYGGFQWIDSTNVFQLGNGAPGFDMLSFYENGDTVINEPGRDNNFRIESDTDANAFVVDGGLNNVGIGTAAPKAKLDVVGTVSGSSLVVNGASQMNGALTIDNTLFADYMFLYDGGQFGDNAGDPLYFYGSAGSNFVPISNNTYDLGTSSARWSTGWFNSLNASAGLSVQGASSLTGNVGIGSANSTTKAVLNVSGVMSGVTVYATKSFSGAGLSDCDTAGTSKLMWDATTGRFSCGTDANTTYTAGQGLALNGTSFRLNATVTGSVIQAANTIASSGTLVWEGAASGASLVVSNATSLKGNVALGDNAGDTITFNGLVNSAVTPSANNTYDFGSSSARWAAGWFNSMNIAAGFSVGGTTSLTGNVGIGAANTTTKATLNVSGVMSGITLYATKSFSGAGLTDCDSGTSKLLWDATTGRFSCGTVTTTNWSNTGSLQLYFDNRYVNTAGDTMTGSLVVQNGTVHTATTTPLINVRGTMSGRGLFISGSGASALLSTTLGKPAVRIGGSGSLVLETRSSDPGSAPANTVGMFAQKTAGRPMLMQASGATMAATAMQTALFGNQIMFIKPGGGATLTADGTQTLDDNTVSHPAADQVFGFMANFATAATSGDDAGTSSANTAAFRGSTAGANGFFYMARVGIVDATNIRIFSGMADQTVSTMVSADNPAGNYVGFQISNPSYIGSNWQFVTKDNTTQNRVDSGFVYAANKVYDLYFMCTKQCAAITWEIRNVTDGTSAAGTTSSNLPTTTAALRMVLGVESETTAAKNIRMQQMYFESDR